MTETGRGAKLSREAFGHRIRGSAHHLRIDVPELLAPVQGFPGGLPCGGNQGNIFLDDVIARELMRYEGGPAARPESRDSTGTGDTRAGGARGAGGAQHWPGRVHRATLYHIIISIFIIIIIIIIIIFIFISRGDARRETCQLLAVERQRHDAQTALRARRLAQPLAARGRRGGVARARADGTTNRQPLTGYVTDNH
jgi:uncharacterized membrane protein